MKTVTTPAETRRLLGEMRATGDTVGFVPTMGALHAGHESLLEAARSRTGIVVASIFVNPRQFGPSEDFDRYPRVPDRDRDVLERLGCDVLFAPARDAVYSPEDRTAISVVGLGDGLCGASRPGHFEGVLLIVAKLLNIVGPDEAYFGQKDAQQAVIIQRMTADLDMPVRIVIGPTVREPDGLAMSSRNAFLSPGERSRAAGMRRGLLEAMEAVRGGERRAGSVREIVRGRMEESGFEIDYAEVVDGSAMEPLEEIGGTVLIAAAGRLGTTRLIDNIALRVEGAVVNETLLEFPEWSRYEL